jgi:hypothetical protein
MLQVSRHERIDLVQRLNVVVVRVSKRRQHEPAAQIDMRLYSRRPPKRQVAIDYIGSPSLEGMAIEPAAVGEGNLPV